MADNQFASTIGALFQGMDEFVTTKTVVGEPVTVGDAIILPLVDVTSYLQEETSPEHLTRAQMIQFGRVGNAVASLCVERRGGISAIPEMEEIEERLRG